MKELSVFLFLLFSLFGHGKSDTTQSSKYLYSLRVNWQLNLMSEWHLGNNFSLVQGIGPTYNIIGYGTDVAFNSEIIKIDLYEQFTYFGGLRFYATLNDNGKFTSKGFDGGYFALHYAINFDRRIKSGEYRRAQSYVDEMNCVGFLMGYQTDIGGRFYANVNVGIGMNTFFIGGYRPLASFDCGWRFWEPTFKD